MAAPKVFSTGVQTITALTGSELILVDTGGPQMSVITAANFMRGTAGGVGTFTANGATAVVVSNTAVTANSSIIFTLKTIGGTPAGSPFVSAITPGTGFSVKAAAGDTSIYNYTIYG